MKKKKVLIVASVVKIHIMAFHVPYLEWFKKNGYEVHVCAKNDYANKNDCKIPFCDKFYDLPFERSPFKKKNIYVLKELKQIIDNNNYDLIHCHTPIGGALTRIASRNSRNNGTEVFYTAHGFHFYKGAPLINWLIYYPTERWLAKYTDVLITINREDYLRARKFKAKRVEYVPGVGIDINKYKFFKNDEEKYNKRKLLGIANEEFVIISVGELNRNKNHKVILKAISNINDKKIKYIICGKGPLEKELIELIEKLGIRDQIKILGFRNDIAELYNLSDLFAFPSYREGLSLSLMEAMSSGLPVVCSNIRGNSDLIEEGRGGFLISPDNMKEFSNKIELIYKNKNIQKEFSEFNSINIKKYSIETALTIMKDLYSSTFVKK